MAREDIKAVPVMELAAYVSTPADKYVYTTSSLALTSVGEIVEPELYEYWRVGGDACKGDAIKRNDRTIKLVKILLDISSFNVTILTMEEPI